MALYQYVLHEGEPDENGMCWLQVGPETEEIRCYICQGEAVPNVCPGDGRYHHHGCVHTPGGGLEGVCKNCIDTVEADWTAHRNVRRSEV